MPIKPSAVLAFLGLNMILKKEEKEESKKMKIWQYALKSLAVSIDAFAVGITITSLTSDVWQIVTLIFGLTFLSVYFGKKLVSFKLFKNLKTLDVLTGMVFIGIGLNILLSHLFDHGFLA